MGLPFILGAAAAIGLLAVASSSSSGSGKKPVNAAKDLNPAVGGPPPTDAQKAALSSLIVPPPIPSYTPTAPRAPSLVKRDTSASPLPSPTSVALTDKSSPSKFEKVVKDGIVYLHGMDTTPTGNWHLVYAYSPEKKHGSFVYVPLAVTGPLFAFAGTVDGPMGDAETKGMWFLLADLMAPGTGNPAILSAHGSAVRSELSPNGIDLEVYLPGFEAVPAGGVAVHHDDIVPIVYPGADKPVVPSEPAPAPAPAPSAGDLSELK